MRGAGLLAGRLGTERGDAGALDDLAASLGPWAERSVPLAAYTSMRVGGPADLLVVAESANELARAVAAARDYGVPWRVLGQGCNVLVADEGLLGLVVVNRAQSVEVDGCRVWAESGTRLAALAQRTIDACLDGLAWAAGLPGTVGGAVVGNAGAFGDDVATTLDSATMLENGGEVMERDNAWFGFSYRGSRLKGDAADQAVVLAATFSLREGDGATLRAKAGAVMEKRRNSQPAGLTMGSTFKNPPGHYAGRLIEQAELKGYRIGGVKVSEKHANFLVNQGGATAEDVRRLIDHVRTVVANRCGVELTLEVEVLGW